MKLFIDIPDHIYDELIKTGKYGYYKFDTKKAIKNGTPFKDCDKWKQLKETISEIRDNNEFEKDDVTTLCGFLLNYMGVLENETDY